MLSPQLVIDLAHELVVDLFAGGGGASTGMELAIGRHVDIAVNHDREAVALHQRNHPQTRHYVEDVFDLDPREVTEGRPVGLLWASPDCTFHSKARGGKPHRDRNRARRRRALAWVVVKWARMVRPRVIQLENVEEFQHWGPLLDDGQPCPNRRGESFTRWVAALRNLGYRVEWRELRACDFGAPTIRKRLFLVARCDGEPITWPAPTHSDPKHAKARGLKLWRTAAECIDWSIPCPSIFERARPLADATLRRIAHGVMRYVVDAGEPFVVRIGHTGHGDAGKVRGIGDPVSTVTSKAEHLLVSAFLAKHYTGVVGSDMAAPIGTVTTADHHSLVSALLIDSAHGDTSPSGAKRWSHGNRQITMPAQTVLASGGNAALVCAFLTAYYGSDQDTPLTDPLHTVTTKERFALVTVRGEAYVIADIGMRMLTPRELYRAQGFGDDYVIHEGTDPFTGQAIPLTKTAQIRMCGNSVCPPLAEALVRANYTEATQRAMEEAA